MNDRLTDHAVETELLINSCQSKMPPNAVAAVSTILQGPIDWIYVTDVASRNAVLPLFSWNLLRHFRDQLPDEIKSVLEGELNFTVRNNMFLTGKLLEILRFFNGNGIEVLPFKGPLLAIQAYGNPGLRRYGDLDVLVKPRQFKEAIRLLEARNYTPMSTLSWLENQNWYISRRKDIYFRDKAGTVNLELHWKLSGSHFGLPKEMNALWGRLASLDLGGTSVPSLAFNDLLIYLCLHGSRHSWERLSWICDVNELIQSEENIDWDSVLAHASKCGCENVLALGLRLIHEFFGFNAPIAGWERIRDDKTYGEIVSRIRWRLFSPEAQKVEIGERYLYHLKLKERPLDRWKLHYHYLTWYLKIILTPNRMDKSVLNLPRMLYPLYYITRPIRLIHTYLLKTENERISDRLEAG